MSTRWILALTSLNAVLCYGLGFFIEELKFLWVFSFASVTVFIIALVVSVFKLLDKMEDLHHD